MAIATFAAGCFWGVEARFREIDGVQSTRVGYTSGETLDPDYKQVCTGTTGHAEAIEVTYDTTKLSFDELLDVFWQLHDPTTLNRQGPDLGTQYRSAIFYHNDEQQQQALTAKQNLNATNTFAHPVVTEITAASIFYPAEDYHQCYLEKKGLGSCH